MAERRANERYELRTLVYAPSGRDGTLLCQMLDRAGLATQECRSADEVCEAITRGAGLLILAEEALNPALITRLTHILDAQPRWSDFPLVLLTARGAVSRQSELQRRVRHPLGNVLLVERPVRPESILSTVHGALRARQRQFEVRDHIEQYRRAEAALRKAEKLALAGRLAASIAHEINNPLTAVTNLHYLMANSRSLEEIKSLLAIADEELARVAEIAKQTLKFHRESSRSTPVDVREVIDSVLTLYRARLRSAGVEAHKEFGDVAPVQGFGGELRQIFANLIGNAVDAMWSGGQLRIRVRAARQRGVQGEEADGVRVTIADSGVGIPAALRPMLFEPFVSTKGNTGTGLGLWVAAEIVSHHAGTIHLKSREHAGTVFSVFLPYSGASNTPVAKSA